MRPRGRSGMASLSGTTSVVPAQAVAMWLILAEVVPRVCSGAYDRETPSASQVRSVSTPLCMTPPSTVRTEAAPATAPVMVRPATTDRRIRFIACLAPCLRSPSGFAGPGSSARRLADDVSTHPLPESHQTLHSACSACVPQRQTLLNDTSLQWG